MPGECHRALGALPRGDEAELLCHTHELLGAAQLLHHHSEEAAQWRYDVGLENIADAASQVAALQKDLEDLQPVLEKAAKETSEMMVKVEGEQVKAEEKQILVDEEAAKADIQAAEATTIKADCT